MRTINVTADREYEIAVDCDWRDSLAAVITRHERVLIVAPTFIVDRFSLRDFLSSNVHLFTTPEGEDQKTISTWESAHLAAGSLNLTRSDAIVAIGGGATTDLAGFVAATWLRGIAWYAVPTTLAGAVDAAIGGKTGINSEYGKNLIGSFYSPSGVYIDLSFLDSLSDRDFAAGLAEVIKTGYIGDLSILDLLHRCEDLSDVRKIAGELVYKSAAFKASIVSQDFTESKLREILNFGHTLGHAIEKREKYVLRHGEAVSIGLVFAAELSVQQLGLKPEVVNEFKALLEKFCLPISYPKSAFGELEELMKGDKKNRGSHLRFVGISAPSTPGWMESVTPQDIHTAYERIAK